MARAVSEGLVNLGMPPAFLSLTQNGEHLAKYFLDAAKKPRSFPGIFRINPNWLGVFIGNFNYFLEVLQVEVCNIWGFWHI